VNLSRPIPKALLPHNAILRTPRSGGIFADGAYDETSLYNVRIEQNEKIRQGNAGEIRTRGASLYYDRVNSSPCGVEFKSEQLILFGGEIYKIEAVKTVMAAAHIHHYRIEMV